MREEREGECGKGALEQTAKERERERVREVLDACVREPWPGRA